MNFGVGMCESSRPLFLCPVLPFFAALTGWEQIHCGYDELAKLGHAEGFAPFFLNLNDTVLESMVIAVSLEHDIIDDVETLTPEQVSAYTRAVLQRYRTARGGASAEEYGSAAIA